MGYASLTASDHHEATDDSEDSIQGSPLLETGPKFSSNTADRSMSFDFSNEVQDPELSQLSASHQFLENGEQGPNFDDDVYGEEYASGYNQIPAISPQNNASRQDYTLPRSHNTERDRRIYPVTEVPSLEYNRFSKTYVHPDSPPLSQQEDDTTASRASISRTRASIKNQHRRTLPPNFPLSVPSISSTQDTASPEPQRPQSSFIRGSFESKDELSSHQDDDDMLPFETTKQMAWQGRPRSMIQLTQLERGPVMSKETFENYRKSMASLGMLKHMSSSGSFRSDGSLSSRKSGNANDYDDDALDRGDSRGEDDEEDEGEDDERTHEQDRKRWSAKVRQEQDARMSIYRQRMTKIIGTTAEPSITLDARIPEEGSNTIRRSSFSNLNDMGSSSDNEEIMDDIPLSILQAHGFPRAKRNSQVSLARAGSSSSSIDLSRQRSPGSPGTLATSRTSLMQGNAGSRNAGTVQPGNTSPVTFYERQTKEPRLPSVFGNSKDSMMSRGLVREIAKEEEFRKRRQTFGFENVMLNESMRGSFQQQQQQQSSSRPASVATSMQPDEMQAKLDQVLNMLSKITTGDTASLSGGGMPPPAMNTMWQTPMHAHQRAPSISSAYTAQTANSSVPAPHAQQFPPFVPGMPPFFGMPPPPFMVPPPSDAASHFGQMPPPHIHTQPPAPSAASPIFPPFRGGPQTQNMSNRPSRMRMVNKDNDTEEDDEAEWKKLMEKRKALREKWKKQEEISSA